MSSSSGRSGNGGEPEVGFAKLQGEDFEYYMQSYSIILGRNSKRAEVDVDLASLGGGMSISRNHARIFYDFSRRRFALDVLGKNGCLVEGVLHLPGAVPVKLDSQDLLQIGDKKFYFLLPCRSLFASSVVVPRICRRDDDDDDDEEEEEGILKRVRRDGRDLERASVKISTKSMKRSRGNREADDHQLVLLEEKDVLYSAASVLSDTCNLGEWMPMAKLHTQMVQRYGDLWHHSKMRRYLTSEDWPRLETAGKPWFGLLMLLRKYPQHFAVDTRSKGGRATEFVSLLSLIP